MSYNFKYTSLPTYTSASLGYLAVNVGLSEVSLNDTTLSTFTLPIGTYLYAVNCNVSSDTPGSYAIISLQNSTGTIIYISNGYTFYPSTSAAPTSGNICSNYVIQIDSETSFMVNANTTGGTVNGDFGTIQVVRIA